MTLFAAPGKTGKGNVTIDPGRAHDQGPDHAGRQGNTRPPMNVIIVAPEDDARPTTR